MKLFNTNNEMKLKAGEIAVILTNYRHGLTWTFYTSKGKGYGTDKIDCYRKAVDLLHHHGVKIDWNEIPAEINPQTYEIKARLKKSKLDELDKEQERRAAFRAFRNEMKREGKEPLRLSDVLTLSDLL